MGGAQAEQGAEERRIAGAQPWDLGWCLLQLLPSSHRLLCWPLNVLCCHQNVALVARTCSP